MRRRSPSSAPHQNASITSVAFCSASDATKGRAEKISARNVSSTTCSAVAHPRAKMKTQSRRTANRQKVAAEQRLLQRHDPIAGARAQPRGEARLAAVAGAGVEAIGSVLCDEDIIRCAP